RAALARAQPEERVGAECKAMSRTASTGTKRVVPEPRPYPRLRDPDNKTPRDIEPGARAGRRIDLCKGRGRSNGRRAMAETMNGTHLVVRGDGGVLHSIVDGPARTPTEPPLLHVPAMRGGAEQWSGFAHRLAEHRRMMSL